MIFELEKNLDLLERFFIELFIPNYKPSFSINLISQKNDISTHPGEILNEVYFSVKDFNELIKIIEILRKIEIPELNLKTNMCLLAEISIKLPKSIDKKYTSVLNSSYINLAKIYQREPTLFSEILNNKLGEIDYVQKSYEKLERNFTQFKINNNQLNLLTGDLKNLRYFFEHDYIFEDSINSRIIFPFFLIYFFFKISERSSEEKDLYRLIKYLGLTQLKRYAFQDEKQIYLYYKQLLMQKIPNWDVIIQEPPLVEDISYYNFKLLQESILNFQDFRQLIIILHTKLLKLNIGGSSGDYHSDFKKFLENHLQVHNDVHSTLDKLKKNFNSIKNRSLSLLNDYNRDFPKISELLNILARSHYELTHLEKSLYIDRSLEHLFKEEVQILHTLVRKTSKNLNSKFKFKDFEYFIKNWSIENLKKIVLDFTIPESNTSFLKNQINKKYNNVVIFLLDGLGYVQYKWLERIEKSGKIAKDFFKILKDSGDNCKEFILGSSLVPDTLVGISKLIFGTNIEELGVPAKNFIDISDTTRRLRHKKIDFNELAKNYLGSKRSILEELEDHGFNCYYLTVQSRNKTDKFTEKVLDNNLKTFFKKKQFFGKLEDILKLFEFNKKNCLLVYYNYIDSENHEIGPFGLKELDEMTHFNLFFFNFFESLKKINIQDDLLFLFTADHGFMELNNEKFIKIRDLTDAFKKDFIISHNSRSFFLSVKNPPPKVDDDLSKIKRKLRDLGINEEDYIIKDNNTISILGSSSLGTRKKAGDYFVSFKDETTIIREQFEKEHLEFRGDHGGLAVEEFFVPLLIFPLDQKIYKKNIY